MNTPSLVDLSPVDGHVGCFPLKNKEHPFHASWRTRPCGILAHDHAHFHFTGSCRVAPQKGWIDLHSITGCAGCFPPTFSLTFNIDQLVLLILKKLMGWGREWYLPLFVSYHYSLAHSVGRTKQSKGSRKQREQEPDLRNLKLEDQFRREALQRLTRTGPPSRLPFQSE